MLLRSRNCSFQGSIKQLVAGNAAFRFCLSGSAPASSFEAKRFTSTADSQPANSLPVAEDQQSGRWGWVLLIPAGFAAFLGCWQVNRYSWKVDLLERRASGLKAEPLELSQIPHAPAQYSRVVARGKFQHERSLYIGPRPRTVMGTANAGYTLVTPLLAKEWNKAVLVNRGWVPAQWRTDADMRSLGSPSGEVTEYGVVRSSEPRSKFVPDNSPAKGEWYWIDVPAMAAACGLPADTPLIELYSKEFADKQGPVPTSMDVLAFKARQPKSASLYPLRKAAAELLSVSVMPVDHRNYAITWFALSAATAFLAYRALRRPVGRRSRRLQ